MDNQNMNNNPLNRNPKKSGMPKFGFGWLYIILLLIIGSLFFLPGEEDVKRVDWSEFQQMMERDEFSKITVQSAKGTVLGEVKENPQSRVSAHDSTSKTLPTGKPLLSRTLVSTDMPGTTAFNDIYQKLLEREQRITAKVSYDNRKDSFWPIILNIAPFLLIIVFWIFITRRMSSGTGGAGGGVFNVGKSRAQLFDKENKVKVTFKDVAGLSGAKQEIEEIVHFLRAPKTYTDLGGKIPKGALLVGPPGTGKTLLAKAVAGEADVPFFSLSGSDFVEMFVGVGASRVRDLFKQAKEKAPCIVFIDEIDAVGRARGKNAGFGGNDERENTLNQLLTEMDGFDTNSGVIILAATNRVDILDKALLRAGRFDRQIQVDLPDLNERKEIFEVHMRRLKLDESVDIDLLSRQTPGFSGADIANVCNEAALIAARNGKTSIDRDDFTSAIDRIVGGLEKKTKITTQEEKKAIAIHEAGHATVSWLLEHANPLIKVTIVPRGRALGAAWYLPEERQITTTEQILDEMCAILGGRAAEEVVLGRISTGAANDLQRATRIAQAMVTYFGMSDKLPNINYQDTQGEYGFTKPFSEETARKIDEEVLRIINEQYARAKELLSTHREGHRKISDMLFEKEVIFTEDVENILGKRPWKSRTEELLEPTQKEGETEPTKQKETVVDNTGE
ncbi:cell division protein FtsH [Porphyromonas cangingivalis]|uniref:ATP-dependent zinc metalloprotease FtsH n=2 Tax=Porphyromonas cangingivalis TaxID=36874 RepID=A0A0A2ER11_PORCN|nr:ATP-dependent zinc metalloprotease FtsH [Porphyromonas cangingivalis]KGN78799.1 cell division protein FtsH [Porphyromonas cangingivalis]